MAAGSVISQAQAEVYLRLDLEKFEKKVEKYNLKYQWNQNEFDALVSFAYNVGSIDQLTANGTRTRREISNKILAYTKSGGKVLSGLVKRRQAEKKLFDGSGAEDDDRVTVRTYSKGRDGDKQISENFKVKEFACKDGSDKILIDSNFVMTHLQDIRTHFNKPVNISSAYRTVSYNERVGGAKNSYHMAGRAFDITIKGVTPAQIASYASSIGVNGIIQYNTFVHLDSRDARYWARNNSGMVTKVNKF